MTDVVMDLRDGLLQHRLAALGEPPDDVALGNDAGDLAVISDDDDGADLLLRELVDDFESGASGRTVATARPFAFKICAIFIGIPPNTLWVPKFALQH